MPDLPLQPPAFLPEDHEKPNTAFSQANQAAATALQKQEDKIYNLALQTVEALNTTQLPQSVQGPKPLQKNKPAAVKPGARQIFPIFCFREAIERSFPPNPPDSVTPASPAQRYSAINLFLPLRSAFANFLFQYKMAVQYPHEFAAYDLSQSAQELNSELNPLIVAFNRDLAAALQPMEDVAKQDMAKCASSVCRSGRNHTTFINNGVITVRTVSGKPTTVDTTTQSFFDATNPPSITDVINSIGTAQSNIPKVLQANLTANEAAVIIGALNSVKPATSQVARSFNLEITPRSLNGASSAELNINMTTSDQGDPTVWYSDGKSQKDNLSRIAKETVDTKVRLESLKLFEISSFTAMLQRSRRNFPLLPPFVEIPYIGSFLSLPVPGAKEYHRSTAVISAVVVPTAADLANGIGFTSDRVLMSRYDKFKPVECVAPTLCKDSGTAVCRADTCDVRKARSLSDLQGAPIREYNKLMIACFSNPTGGSCNYTFQDVLHGE